MKAPKQQLAMLLQSWVKMGQPHIVSLCYVANQKFTLPAYLHKLCYVVWVLFITSWHFASQMRSGLGLLS